MQDINKREMFNHIKEECIKDPLYLFKIIMHTFGRNALGLVLRISAYVAVYWVVATYTDIPKTVIALLILVIIMSYHSIRAAFDKIKEGVKGGKVKQ